MKTVGNAKRGEVEARYQYIKYPGRPIAVELDEVVANCANVHLEAMNETEFALIIDTKKESVCFMIGAKRAAVRVRECWREKPIKSVKALRKRAGRT